MYIYIYTHVNNHYLQELQDGPGIIGFSWIFNVVLAEKNCNSSRFNRDIMHEREV